MSSHEPILKQIVAGAILEMESHGAVVSHDSATDKIRVANISGLDVELIAKWRSLVSDHRGRIVAFLTERSREAERAAREASQKARAAAEIKAMNKLDADAYLLPAATRSYMQAVHRVVKRDHDYLDRMLDKRAAEQKAYNDALNAEIDRQTGQTRDSS